MDEGLLNLSGKNALIIGSSQGIGRAIALALVEFGASVRVHNRREAGEAH